jgi:hypothetical protein
VLSVPAHLPGRTRRCLVTARNAQSGEYQQLWKTAYALRQALSSGTEQAEQINRVLQAQNDTAVAFYDAWARQLPLLF